MYTLRLIVYKVYKVPFFYKRWFLTICFYYLFETIRNVYWRGLFINVNKQDMKLNTATKKLFQKTFQNFSSFSI